MLCSLHLKRANFYDLEGGINCSKYDMYKQLDSARMPEEPIVNKHLEGIRMGSEKRPPPRD